MPKEEIDALTTQLRLLFNGRNPRDLAAAIAAAVPKEITG